MKMIGKCNGLFILSSAFRFDRNLSITENSMILRENYDTSDIFYHWQRNCTIRNRCHVILVVLHVNFLFITCRLIANLLQSNNLPISIIKDSIKLSTNRPKSKKKLLQTEKKRERSKNDF